MSPRRWLSVAAATCLIAAATEVSAQTGAGQGDMAVGGTVALASLFDDETHLGTGVGIAGEATMPLGDYMRVGVEGGWFGHERDAGYLRADGSVTSLMARASLLVGPRAWLARPFIGAGVGLARSSGTLITASPGAGGFDLRRSWTLTRPAWDVHLGVRVAAGDRLFVRPELRAGFIGGSGDTTALEPPLVRLQAGVAFEWTIR